MLVPVLRIGVAVAIGAGLGALVGRTRSCETGGCPLTANPRRGALYGGVVALLFAFSCAMPSGPMIEEGSGIVKVASPAEFQQQVDQSAQPAVVYFHASWCGACKKFAPSLNEFARKNGEKATYIGVDTDEAPELAEQYSIQYLPTTVVVRDGREEARFVGAFDTSQLLELLKPPQTASRNPETSPH